METQNPKNTNKKNSGTQKELQNGVVLSNDVNLEQILTQTMLLNNGVKRLEKIIAEQKTIYSVKNVNMHNKLVSKALYTQATKNLNATKQKLAECNEQAKLLEQNQSSSAQRQELQNQLQEVERTISNNLKKLKNSEDQLQKKTMAKNAEQKPKAESDEFVPMFETVNAKEELEPKPEPKPKKEDFTIVLNVEDNLVNLSYFNYELTQSAITHDKQISEPHFYRLAKIIADYPLSITTLKEQQIKELSEVELNAVINNMNRKVSVLEYLFRLASLCLINKKEQNPEDHIALKMWDEKVHAILMGQQPKDNTAIACEASNKDIKSEAENSSNLTQEKLQEPKDEPKDGNKN